jgi:hypothetical protein
MGWIGDCVTAAAAEAPPESPAPPVPAPAPEPPPLPPPNGEGEAPPLLVTVRDMNCTQGLFDKGPNGCKLGTSHCSAVPRSTKRAGKSPAVKDIPVMVPPLRLAATWEGDAAVVRCVLVASRVRSFAASRAPWSSGCNLSRLTWYCRSVQASSTSALLGSLMLRITLHLLERPRYPASGIKLTGGAYQPLFSLRCSFGELAFQSRHLRSRLPILIVNERLGDFVGA